MQGFEVLIEREWLDFGHKFADRCGNGVNCEDVNERCPVFLQWLECVYQLLLQFPCEFEFNEAFLVSRLFTLYFLWLRPTAFYRGLVNIGVKHGFSCINIRQSRGKCAGGLGFQHLPRDLVNVNALKNRI